MPSSVFISYAHEDQKVADEIFTAIHRSRLASAFLATVALGPSDSLTSKIGSALDAACAVVAILSRSSITSSWVRRELGAIGDRGVRIIPLRLDAAEWPGSLRLVLEDRLYIDVAQDSENSIGKIPKLFTAEQLDGADSGFDKFLPLRGGDQRSPHLQVFRGTLESFWENNRFGRTAVVLPTNNLIDLGGRVATSFLSNLGIEAREIQKSVATISSSQVAVLTPGSTLPEGSKGLKLLASTVFNSHFRPRARDQWNAAQAILDQADNLNCTLVLVPPLGTGSFDWPVRQAVVNWIYGAIQWARRRPTTTNLSVWPILCVPGPGDQNILAPYLQNFTPARRESLIEGKIGIRLRYNNEESDEKFVSDNLLLGGLARNLDQQFKRDLNWRFRHGKHLRQRSSQQPFEYSADTPVDQTIFADGDIIELVRPGSPS